MRSLPPPPHCCPGGPRPPPPARQRREPAGVRGRQGSHPNHQRRKLASPRVPAPRQRRGQP
eukprot:6917482-Alexandrium_andersonii.AAC.1